LIDTPLSHALAASVDDVLEKMFFVRSLGAPLNESAAPLVAAHLTFQGDPPGWLTLRVTAGAARSVAADFLGEEESELSEAQIGEVVCELANMICGSMLSRVESNTLFRLATPRLIAPDTGSANPDAGVPASATTCAAEISSGAITVIFNMEIPACSAAEKSES
jgi:CheY-specific phosphatase CheX